MRTRQLEVSDMETRRVLHRDVSRVTEILRPLFELSSSVYLTGSYANSEKGPGSDIDLLIVTTSQTNTEAYESQLQDVFRASELKEIAVDARIYSQDTLRNDLAGVNHFLLWSSLANGILLYGEEITVKLEVLNVYQSMKAWLNRLDETGSFLEMRIHYSACCYDLYSALVWFYFIKRYLVANEKEMRTKTEILEAHFDSCLKSVSRNYEKLARQYREMSKGKRVMRIRDDGPGMAFEKEFGCLLDSWKSIYAYCQDVYKSVSESITY